MKTRKHIYLMKIEPKAFDYLQLNFSHFTPIKLKNRPYIGEVVHSFKEIYFTTRREMNESALRACQTLCGSGLYTGTIPLIYLS